jgi:AraC-like DNA-binding protein
MDYCDVDRELTPGITYGPVIRDAFVVEVCESGRGTVIINGREFQIKAGDCYFLLPGDTVIHTADDVEPRCGYWCFFDGISIGEILKRGGITSETPFAPPECFEPVREILKAMYLGRNDSDNGAEMRRAALIYSILGELLRCEKSSDKNIWVKRAVGIMETRYCERVTVSSIAREVGLDRCYFASLFKDHTGISQSEYLERVRINKACSLLKEGGHSVSEIAEAVGMDGKNFSRVFKRKMGIAPLEYRCNKG